MKQLFIYFGLAYLISWTIWFPLYAHIFGLKNLPVLPYHHAVGGFGPMIAGFITTMIFYGREGVLKFVRLFFHFRSLLMLLVALLGPFLLAVLASFIQFITGKGSFDLSGLLHYKEFPGFNLLSFFGYNLLFFGFGEEAGWRGFALPHLQKKFNALTAGIILTFFWALWHWPLFFYRPGYLSMDMAGIAGWFFSLLTGSILLSWLFNSSGGSILVCAIFHATIDIAFTADYADKNIVGYMGFLITVWGVLTVFIFKPAHLSRKKRVIAEQNRKNETEVNPG